VPDFAVRFNDFSGGDWGDTDPAKAKVNQFSGKNVLPYGSGLLGVRAGWKLLDLTGKVPGGAPATYSGIVRGFDLMRNRLTLVLDTKSYDIYWDLGLAPGGTLPNEAAATLPGSIASLANASLLWTQDTGGVKEWLLVDGKLCLKSTGATPTWQLLSAVGGATAPPNPLSVLTRWGLYLVAVEQTVPWRIRFTNVDAAGPNFLIWPANNYLDMSTTDPVTTLKGIFNLLYAGKASGWHGISGVLGTLASVRELAIGNGPIDQRAASVTTDNRVAYWPLQKVPAFWNGERVSLVDDQRMDPRTTWLDTTPVMARTAPNIGSNPKRINTTTRFDNLALPTVLRDIGTPPWTASPARTGDATFGTQQRPTIAGAPNDPAGSFGPHGTKWSFGVAGRVVGVRYQRMSSSPNTLRLRMWRDSNQTLVQDTIDTQAGASGAFNVNWSSPVLVAAGETWTFAFDGTADPIYGGAQAVTNTAGVTFVGYRQSSPGNQYPADASSQTSFIEPLFEPYATPPVGTFNAQHSASNGSLVSVPPGWTALQLNTYSSVAPQAWVATDATNTAWRATAATGPVDVRGDVAGQAALPAGCLLALFVNGTEVARTTVTKPTTATGVHTEMSFAINDVLSLRFFNVDAVNPIDLRVNHSNGNTFHLPKLQVLDRATEAAGEHWVCPTTGRYDLHYESCGGQSLYAYQLLINRRPIASCTPGPPDPVTFDDFSLNAIDVNDVALTAGDLVGIGVVTQSYGTPPSYVNRIDGGEGTAMPYLRITNRATQQVVGTLGMFGDSVVVTPTEKRLLMAGDDGATTKVWSYGGGIWTHHEYDVLIAGLAPSDVKMSYLLPEHVVWATKRSYNAEPLKVWSINHDIDRPAFVSDPWASPYDQGMKSGDVLVKGEASLPMWFDGQGRQSRVRSVIVQFVKWNQGVVGGVNQISARVDSIGPYDRGITPGIEATWSEPMSGAANTDAGTEDSWRFNVGEQGFGNGFQLVFTALYGVAIREVVVLVDLRTERT